MKEASLLKIFISALFILIVTGTINLLFSITPLYQQMLSLLHLLTGILSSSIAFYYGFQHTKRTLGFRRTMSVFIGCMAFVGFFISLVTGLILAVTGVTEAYKAYLTVHHFSSYFCVLLTIIHLIVHWLSFPLRRLKSQGSFFMTLNLDIYKSLLIAAVSSITFLLIVILMNSYTNEIEKPQYIQNYVYKYGEGKFLPSMVSTEGDRFIKKNQIADSQECIECHEATGEQWLASAHRHAANDPTYVRNINLLEKKKGIEATRYCEGCHAPIALLTGQLTTGGKHAGVSGTTANHEGISCMSCHGINQVHSTQGNASYNFIEKRDYLFQNTKHKWLKKLNHLSIKLRPQQHKADLLSPVLQSSSFCSSCHSQFMEKSMNDWGWIKMQDEYLAWSNSKFNLSRDTRFSHPESKNCQSCHMPLMSGADMAANETGKINSHYFVGGNVMLAKQFNNEKLFELTEEFLQQDKVSIYIVPPEDSLAQQSSLFINPNLGVDTKHPIALYRGGESKLSVLISNHGVGHNFPAGAIDLSEAWIEFKVIDGAQRNIYSSGHLLDSGSIENNATVYKEVAVDKFGKPVWRHDLFNMVGRSYINYVPAGATDIIDYKFTVPDWAVSPINISATLKYRKLNQKYLDWVRMKNVVKDNPIIDMSRDTLSISLKKAPRIR